MIWITSIYARKNDIIHRPPNFRMISKIFAIIAIIYISFFFWFLIEPVKIIMAFFSLNVSIKMKETFVLKDNYLSKSLIREIFRKPDFTCSRIDDLKEMQYWKNCYKMLADHEPSKGICILSIPVALTARVHRPIKDEYFC